MVEVLWPHQGRADDPTQARGGGVASGALVLGCAALRCRVVRVTSHSQQPFELEWSGLFEVSPLFTPPPPKIWRPCAPSGLGSRFRAAAEASC